MNQVGKDLFAKAFAGWEKMATTSMAEVVRHPQTLALGAGLMRAQLLWLRAFDLTCEAMTSPLTSLSQETVE